MATAKKNKGEEFSDDPKKGTDKPADTDGDGFNAGDGWKQVNPEAGERAYYRKGAGDVVQGILLGRYERRDEEDSYFYQFRLLAPSNGTDAGGDPVLVEVGDVLTVDETSAMSDLKSTSEKDGVWEVRIEVGEKRKLKGGRTFWPMTIYTRLASKASLSIAGM